MKRRIGKGENRREETNFENLSRFRYKKLRIVFAWIGGILLFLISHLSDRGFRLGIPLVVLGESIRIWALGSMEKKGKKLATSGPFAFVRNPLYIGSFFIGLGIVAISQSPFILFVFLIGFLILYRGTIKDEERLLKERFGEPYVRYLKAVPRFLPKLKPYPHREKIPFQWKLLFKHREQIAFLGLALLLAGLYLWEEVIVEGEFMWKAKTALGGGLALIVALAFDFVLRLKEDLSKSDAK